MGEFEFKELYWGFIKENSCVQSTEAAKDLRGYLEKYSGKYKINSSITWILSIPLNTPLKNCRTDILHFSEPQLSELEVLLQFRNCLFSIGHVQVYSMLSDHIHEGKD